jgi:hypothetical protein
MKLRTKIQLALAAFGLVLLAFAGMVAFSAAQ